MSIQPNPTRHCEASLDFARDKLRAEATCSTRKHLFILLLLLFSISCQTQQDSRLFETAPLYGMIYDLDRMPCGDVRIAVDGTDAAVSDLNGRFSLPDLPRGAHEVSFAQENYENLVVAVDFLDRTQVLHVRMISFSQLLRLAQDALAERRWADADSMLSRASLIRPEDPEYLYTNATGLYLRGRFEEARALLESLVAAGTDEAAVQLLLADVFQYGLGNATRAADCLRLFLERRYSRDVEERLESIGE